MYTFHWKCTNLLPFLCIFLSFSLFLLSFMFIFSKIKFLLKFSSDYWGGGKKGVLPPHPNYWGARARAAPQSLRLWSCVHFWVWNKCNTIHSDNCIALCNYVALVVVHSFIHPGHFYSAPSSPLLLRGAPDYSTDTVSEFHAEAHRQLQVKDLPKVPKWRLERESNPRPSG